ncbi:cyclic nucleotide-binding/CBS domain-containing protein [Candidatus Hecatella orcuttiae]|jgi:predicted transcriptional regulator|uniref:CBS domain-containing protein n=1 Tax=Candidatus Hecatella orcuttiae TaxID=1935119 RepID=UPI002867EC62|nr:CBS domain-containing protein [Candidatus Hecatella orcuttiae]
MREIFMAEKIPEMPSAARLLMKADIPAAESTASVLEVARMMRENRLRNVFILKAGKPVGILRDNDLVTKVMALQKDPAALKAEEVMDSFIPVVEPDTGISDIAKLMADSGTRRVLVVEKGKTVGSITAGDLLHFIAFVSRGEWMRLQRTKTQTLEE